MILNKYGQIAFNEWLKTPEIRNNVELGEFVIMPNHVHGVIRILNDGDGGVGRRGVSHTPNDRSVSHTPNDRGVSHTPNDRGVSHTPNDTCVSHTPNDRGVCDTPNDRGVCDTPLRSTPIIPIIPTTTSFQSPSKNIGAIIRGYKSSVIRQITLLGFNEKLWQGNYYEHIIRNDQALERISNYIINNPAKWQEDKFFE